MYRYRNFDHHLRSNPYLRPCWKDLDLLRLHRLHPKDCDQHQVQRQSLCYRDCSCDQADQVWTCYRHPNLHDYHCHYGCTMFAFRNDQCVQWLRNRLAERHSNQRCNLCDEHNRFVCMLPAVCRSGRLRSQRVGHPHRCLQTRIPSRLHIRPNELRRGPSRLLRCGSKPPNVARSRLVRGPNMRKCAVRFREARRRDLKACKSTVLDYRSRSVFNSGMFLAAHKECDATGWLGSVDYDSEV